MRISGGRAIQAEGTANAKAMSRTCLGSLTHSKDGSMCISPQHIPTGYSKSTCPQLGSLWEANQGAQSGPRQSLSFLDPHDLSYSACTKSPLYARHCPCTLPTQYQGYCTWNQATIHSPSNQLHRLTTGCFTSPSFSFPICKMGMLTAFATVELQ